MKIKYIFFDLDNTLFNSKELALQARKNAINAMIDAGLPADNVDSAYEKLRAIIDKEGANYSTHFNDLAVEYGVTENISHIVAAGVVAYHNTKFEYLKPFPDAESVLTELGKKYKFGIITNGRAVKQWDKLIRLGLHHFFEFVVISEEVGVSKPDKKMFERGLELAGCAPDEAVMVGDNEKDMAAKELGIKTISIGEGKGDYNIKEFSEISGVVEEIDK